ncbi:peptidoglycan DD-metalloendopeptidase family protein [Penaeicola halotolerans]|uniref:peptidoglycan DD-metalloendopeptidase family protein n=1 Tax=Penaeicola halotolerans TaxID=2793196 RepID=UPI001CF8363B|nr:peptidoglycan DD-metalloendopeptidase family protein [Penaeicola halotolerans]
MHQIATILKAHQADIKPIMGQALSQDRTMKMDFSPTNGDLEKIDLLNTIAFDAYVSELLAKEQKTYGVGGYMEKRAIYQRSEVFLTDPGDFRNIHLGVDIWTTAGHPVYAPLDGVVHSFQDNAGFGNYGPTIILAHKLSNFTFFTLYGHLSLIDLKGLAVGKSINAGDAFCTVGPHPENGHWPPHLHFQVMTSMLNMTGDFPGVCREEDQEWFKLICPDPNLILLSEVL